MKILYVEDNPFDADITRRELHRQAPQLQLDVVATLAAAYQRLETSSQAYTAVLLDLRLPDGDGLSLLNYIRAHELPLVVVILTGGGDEETVVSALKAGADDYIIKHNDYLHELPHTLDNAIRRFETGQEVRDRRLRVLYAENEPSGYRPDPQPSGRYATAYIQLDILGTKAKSWRLYKHPDTANAYDVLLLDYGIGRVECPGTGQTVFAADRAAPAGGAGRPGRAMKKWPCRRSNWAHQITWSKARAICTACQACWRTPFILAELEREQRALRESEWRFRLLAENAQDGIFRFLVSKNCFDYVSPAMTEIFGYLAEEFYCAARNLAKNSPPAG